VLPSGGLGSIDRETELAFCSAEVILSFRAVAHHVVVILCPCALHFMDGFNDMLVHIVKIMPIVDLCGQDRTCRKCQCESKSRSKSLHGNFLQSKYVEL
jgi:hypothetical protein